MLEMFSQQNASTFQHSYWYEQICGTLSSKGKRKTSANKFFGQIFGIPKAVKNTWELAGVVFFIFVSTVRT